MNLPANEFRIRWENSIERDVFQWLNQMTPGWDYDAKWRKVVCSIVRIGHPDISYGMRVCDHFLTFRTKQHAMLFKLAWGESKMTEDGPA